jgi:hypothetical protein
MTRISFLLLASCAFLAVACEKHPLEGTQSYGSGKHAETQPDSGVAHPTDATKAGPTATPAPDKH